MIFFRFKIDNPWRKRFNISKNDYYWKHRKLSKNKNFEIQISRFVPTELVNVGIDLRWRGQDHQGPEIDLNIYGYMFNVKIYDRRHWNWEENRWQTDEEAIAEAKKWRDELEK
jgi:hypothetical protein